MYRKITENSIVQLNNFMQTGGRYQLDRNTHTRTLTTLHLEKKRSPLPTITHPRLSFALTIVHSSSARKNNPTYLNIKNKFESVLCQLLSSAHAT
jgi:hypothetical protein